MPEERTLEDLREEGWLPLPEAARRVGKSTRSLERRRQEGRLRVEEFTIGRAHRVLTKPEYLEESFQNDREALARLHGTELARLRGTDPREEHMIEPYYPTARAPSSESALRRLVEELTRENVELRLRVAELEDQLARR